MKNAYVCLQCCILEVDESSPSLGFFLNMYFANSNNTRRLCTKRKARANCCNLHKALSHFHVRRNQTEILLRGKHINISAEITLQLQLKKIYIYN